MIVIAIVMEQKNERIKWQCNVNKSETNVYYGLIT